MSVKGVGVISKRKRKCVTVKNKTSLKTIIIINYKYLFRYMVKIL